MVDDECDDAQDVKMDAPATTKASVVAAHEIPQDHRLSHPGMLSQDSPHLPTPHPASSRSRTASSHQESGSSANAATATATCRLLALPAELRELIWIHAVTEFVPAREVKQISPTRRIQTLEKRPIRMDRLNRPLPAPITRVSRQVQAETLPLYYQKNIFECWRPLFWRADWSVSTLIDWLNSLQLREIKWLRHIVLLYKSKEELEYDVEAALLEHGYELNNCTITSKLELSEYEQCFEELGLPRHFGRKKRNDRYGIAHANAS